jgi:histone acetyltransferase 1
MVYLWLTSRPDVAELTGTVSWAIVSRDPLLILRTTVEDPSEAFQDLRDKADLHLILAQDIFAEKQPPVDRDWSESVRKELKLGQVRRRLCYSPPLSLVRPSDLCPCSQRQFTRLMEMALMLKLERGNPSKEKTFRLFIKERLYRFNYVRAASLSLSIPILFFPCEAY